MIYFAFVRSNMRFLCFGVLLTAAASFGQTFFIALYMGEAREAFDLSHGEEIRSSPSARCSLPRP